MDWKDLATTVGKVAPMLGGLLTGPVGTAVTIGGMIASALGTENTPDAVSQALAINPDAAVKLREIESNERVQLTRMSMELATAEIRAVSDTTNSVNQTMQAEATSEHWPSYSWRPFIGFCVGFNTAVASILALVVFVPVMFGVPSAPQAMGQLPAALGALAAINATVLPILGIASWFRGKMQADPNVPSSTKG